MTKLPFLFFALGLILSACGTAVTQPVLPVQTSTPTLPPTPTQTPVPPTATITPLPTIPTLSTKPAGLPDETLPSGLGVAIHYEFIPETYMPIPEYILLKEANIGIVRDEIWPGAICDAPPWCYEFFDLLVKNMSKIGVRVVFLLRDNEYQGVGTEVGRRKFVRFAEDAARHFKGKGVIWEMWNEPELDYYWKPYSNPKDYSILANETIEAIRRVDPGAVIIGPTVATLSTIFGNNSWRFLTYLGEAGTLSKFDAIDVHLYNGGTPESQIENLRKLRRLIDSYSPERKIPIVSTEWGDRKSVV